MRKHLALVSLIVCAACSGSPVAPTSAPANFEPGTLSSEAANALSGTWKGTTTPTNFWSTGSAGTLTAIFDTDNGTERDGQATWISGLTHQTYTGTVDGTISNLVVTVKSEKNCSYKASGAISDDQKHFNGSYHGSGAGCAEDAGTFALTKQ